MLVDTPRLSWYPAVVSSQDSRWEDIRQPVTPTVCVSLSPGERSLELDEMMLEVLAAQGFRPTSAQDGDPRALSAQFLLLVGDGCWFNGYARLLARRRPKPITVLWQLHSLPPPGLSQCAERSGLHTIEQWERLKVVPYRYRRLIGSVVPSLVRSRLPWLQYALFSHLFRKETCADHPRSLRELDSCSRYLMMKRHLWFKRRFPEGWLDYVFASSVPRAKFLISRGIPARCVPIGYHPLMGEDLRLERDIDVFFIGGLKGRRRHPILAELGRKLTARGLTLVAQQEGRHGRERTELLNRARISLNLVNYSWDLPGLRFLMSMACGALVVSEPLDDPAPYEAGKHFVQASLAQLPDTIEHYLSHPRERDMVVSSAYSFVTQELTLENSVSNMMRACGADSALPTGHTRTGN